MREPSSDGGLQGPRRPQSRRTRPDGEGRRHRRLDGQSRPVARVRRWRVRRAGHDRRPKGREPAQAGGEERERRAAASGTRYVHSGNAPYLIAGVATAALEVLLERPDIDVFIVPVGGGSGASGAALVAKTLRPDLTVIGVQAEGASAAYRAWRDRAPRTTERAATFAEGLATRASFDLPQRMLAALLDDFVLVTDDQLYAAMRLLMVDGHVVAEGAGAAPVAAARRLAERLAGKRVACWVGGGNATAESLRRALDQR